MTRAQNARASRSASNLEEISGAVERELALLREARPALETRIDRAAGVLVTQLSSTAKTRPIKCRIRKGGRRVYLVSSLTSGGITYEVDAKTFECSCPDAHRRGVGCKHALGCFLLWRASRPRRAACADCGESFHPDRLLEVQEGQAEETLNPGSRVCRVCAPRHGLTVPGQRVVGCDACRDNPGWRLVEEAVVDAETGELVVATNPVKCRKCAPPEPGLLSDQEMEEWMASVPWREATTYPPPHDHSYTLRKLQDPERFGLAARTIWAAGYDRWYLRRPWRTLHVGDYILWLWTRPQHPRQPYPEDTEVINRVEAAKARVV